MFDRLWQPSTFQQAPCTRLARGLTMNAATALISSGLPKRPKGMAEAAKNQRTKSERGDTSANACAWPLTAAHL